MGKRVYNKPMLMTEAFVPQEYVAACETYKIACLWSLCNDEQELWNDLFRKHREDNCGSIDNNVVVTNKNGVILSVKETNTMMNEDLEMNITTNLGVDKNLSAWVGDTIEWKTSYGGLEWTHKGVVTSIPSSVNANNS